MTTTAEGATLAISPSFAPGVRVRSYELVARLDEGGMGEVWSARHTKTGRAVALKLLKDQSRDAAQRFIREARLARRVEHPNVVRVHELVRAKDGLLAVAMEHLSGSPLSAFIVERGALPVAFVARTGAALASALAVTHGLGIVHRDLKPANVFVAHEGAGWIVKLLDFGVAHDVTEPDHGEIIGTPGYMAPEQALGTAIDHRADVWALGVLMHEALTGVRLFAGNDLASTMRATLDAPIPDLSRVVPAVPSRIAALVASMLERDRDRRLHDLAHVYDTLAGYGGLAPSVECSLPPCSAPTLFSFAA